MKIKYSLIAFLLFFMHGILHAQKRNSPGEKAIICGTSDSAARVELLFYTNNFAGNLKFAAKYNAEITDHTFKITLPAFAEPTYVNIGFIYPYRLMNLLELYLIEPGDSINISQSSTGFYFPGKNSAKFSCQYQMQLVKSKTLQRSWQLTKDVYDEFAKHDFAYDSIREERLKILASSKPQFGNKAYELMRLDCIYAPISAFYANMDLALRFMRGDSAAQKEAIRYYSAHYRHKEIDTTKSIDQVSSYRFIELLIRKAAVDGELALHGYEPAIYNFRSRIEKNTFATIDKNYTGLLKQHLFANFFAKSSLTLDSLNDCLTAAIKQVDQPFLQDILLNVQRRSKGVPAYDFSLPDSNGKKVTLSNYRGKVVIVDFWFTGCEWCIEMAKVLKITASEKDTGIVYMTICIDNSKSKWKESLKRGIFTSTDEINLYTDGLGNNHPLIKHYNISGYPLLLVIDKAGKIFAVNPELGFGVEPRAKILNRISHDLAKQVL